jgi:hypothetical protein
MVDVQTVSIVIASAGVLIGVVYYILDMRNQARVRRTDLFMRLWELGTTDEYMGALEKATGLQFKDYEDYVTKYGSFLSENPTQRAVWRVLGLFGLLGALVYRKLLDLEMVYHYASPQYLIMLYERFKPVIDGLRKEFNEPFLFGDFVYLCNELAKNYPRLTKTWKKREQGFEYLYNEMKKREQNLKKSRA